LPNKDKTFICCGLHRYKAVMKNIVGSKLIINSSEGKSWLSWSNNGPKTDINSLNILIDWLVTAGKYN